MRNRCIHTCRSFGINVFAETTEIEELAILASCYRVDFAVRAEELLARLELLDPDFAHRVITTIGDRHAAALWLIGSNQLLNGVSPLFAVANGRRESVLRLSAERNLAAPLRCRTLHHE